MKLLTIIMLVLLVTNTFSAEDPIADRILQSQTAGKKIILVLGATPPESGNFRFSSFDQDPFIVYFSVEHFRGMEHPAYTEATANTIGEWEKQFIQGDFNNLSDLEHVQHRFGACFDLITLDFSVSKFMNFTDQHLQRFLEMLTTGGTMVFDYSPSCAIVCLKGNSPIQSDEKGLELCFEWLNPSLERLEYKPYIKVNWRHKLSSESDQLLRDFYAQYVAGWKSIHMPNTCNLYVVENNIFPYWQATGHGDRDRWISELRHYLIMRRLS